MTSCGTFPTSQRNPLVSYSRHCISSSSFDSQCPKKIFNFLFTACARSFQHASTCTFPIDCQRLFRVQGSNPTMVNYSYKQWQSSVAFSLCLQTSSRCFYQPPHRLSPLHSSEMKSPKRMLFRSPISFTYFLQHFDDYFPL
jgi:hypothetical protein